MKTVLQNNNQDCLLACYCMILLSKGSKVNLYELYDGEMIPPDGLSAKYLEQLNIRFGLTMNVYKAEATKALDAMKEVKSPFIVQWQMDHFIIVEKVLKNNVKVIDPALGKLSLTKSEFKNGYSGYIISLVKNEQFKPIKTGNNFYKQLLPVFKGKNIWFYLLALVLTQFSSVAFSILIRETLKNTLPVLYLLLFLLTLVLGRLIGYLLEKNAQTATNLKFENIISRKTFSGLFSRPFLYFRNNPTGALLEKLNLRTSIRDSILFNIIPSMINFFSVFFLFIYLTYISMTLSIITFILITSFILINYFIYKYRLRANMSYVQNLIQTSTEMQEDLDQIDVIKALSLENKYSELWRKTSLNTQSSYNKLLQINSLSNFFGQTFMFVSLTILMIVGVTLVNKNYVSIADLVLFQTTASMFISSATQVQTAIFEFSNISIYGNNLEGLLEPSNIENMKEIESPSNIAIKVSNLIYQYTDGQDIIDQATFSINKGEKVAILGESGSGKSTLLSLMLGLLNSHGTIKFGYSNFKSKIGIVLQGMSLKKGTVLENIYEGNLSEAKVSKINDVLEDVNILQVVNELPKKIFSQLFQQGKNLSGGQVQRLLIARSLLNDNKLIFWDEAFSSLDNLNRETIYKNILDNKKYKQKTIIMISHHLDIVDHVDKILFIDDHKVYLQSHKELLATSEAYREFIQKGER